MIVVVGAKPGLVIILSDQLQTYDASRKSDRAIEIWRAEPDVAELLD
jgi:hypothetical protein